MGSPIIGATSALLARIPRLKTLLAALLQFSFLSLFSLSFPWGNLPCEKRGGSDKERKEKRGGERQVVMFLFFDLGGGGNLWREGGVEEEEAKM